MKNTKTLIIGAGQIGKALYEVLSPYYETEIIDKNPDQEPTDIDIIHICFPYFKGFEKEVKRYQKKYDPEFTVIHSTVPVGTSRKCNAIHSPVRGMHPYLAKSIKTFVKFVGGKHADKAAEYLRRANIKTYICRKSETTELGKLLSTTYYATCIEYVKMAEKICEEKDVPFSEAFTLFNQSYNEAWKKLNHSEYVRPTLIPIQRGQGGHCTASNAMLFHENDQMVPFAEIILEAGSVPQTENPLEDKVWLYSQYIGKKRSSLDIGRELNCTDANVLRAMRKWNIPRRDRKWAKEEIKKLLSLYEQGLNFQEISDEMKNRSYDAVRHQAYDKLDLESNYEPGEATKKSETRKKISATLQGVTKEEWKGFKRSLNEILRKSEKYKKWRAKVYVRDKYTCQKCGTTDKPLHAHHIKPWAKYPKLRFKVDNGITLCRECHIEKHKKQNGI